MPIFVELVSILVGVVNFGWVDWHTTNIMNIGGELRVPRSYENSHVRSFGGSGVRKLDHSEVDGSSLKFVISVLERIRK